MTSLWSCLFVAYETMETTISAPTQRNGLKDPMETQYRKNIYSNHKHRRQLTWHGYSYFPQIFKLSDILHTKNTGLSISPSVERPILVGSLDSSFT